MEPSILQGLLGELERKDAATAAHTWRVTLYTRALAERFGVSPGQILYVGDHPHYDVAGSIDAGYHAVSFHLGKIAYPPQQAVGNARGTA